MTVSDKVSYLKGLADGLDLDKNSKEGKLFAAIIDTLDTICCELTAIEESAEALNDEVDAISEDLEDVENVVFDDDDDFDEDEDEDDEDDSSACPGCCAKGGDGEDGFIYEVKCPACDCEFTVDEDALALVEVVCPECGENLEFDFSEDDEDEDSDEGKDKKEDK